jgi:hypothetical protein
VNRRYPLTASRAHHRCEYCRAPEAAFNFPFEVEHVVPHFKKGPDVESNWALACRSCNLRKDIKVTAEDPISNECVPLFDPREDIWDEHFLFEILTAVIRGVTPIGRATADCLDLNSADQIDARKLWFEMGLYP